MTAPLRLEMEGIGKSFGGVPVLRQVSLQVRAGQVLALLGANGAGKSTLVKILCGAYPRDGGSIRLDGEEVLFATPQEAARCGVRLLPQEISVLPDLSVAENICIAALPRRRWRIDWQRMREEAGRRLGQLGVRLDPDAPVKRLSLPEQRLVEIARALAGKTRVLVMDEPTAALTDQESQALFRVIASLEEQGVSLIYISHYLDEVFQVADRIAVLRDGRNAGEFVPAATGRQEVLEAMLGTAIEQLYPEGGGAAGEVVLQVEELSIPGALEGLSFAVRRGQIAGIFGLIGSGVAQVGRAIYGTGPAPGGRFRVNGRPYRPGSVRRAREAGIGLVAAERQREGIVPDLSVRANLTLPFLERFRRRGRIWVAAERQQAGQWIAQMGIQPPDGERQLRFLSGGNQQKVCLARWLAAGVQVLVLEEPTRGVDLGARRGIYAALRQLADRGLGILVASSDAEEVAGLCDAVLVLDRGRVAARFGRGVSPVQLLAAAVEAAGGAE